MLLAKFQLGKNKLTQNFLSSLRKTFKNRELVKIAVLKSCSRDREEVEDIGKEICKALEKKEKKGFTCKIVGFTLFIKKWRKLRKSGK